MAFLKKALSAAAVTTLLMSGTAFADDSSSSSSATSASSTSTSSSSTSSVSSVSSASSTTSTSSSSSSEKEDKRGRGAQGKGRGADRGRAGKNMDAACAQTAVRTRDDALIAALTARRDALVTAWGMTDVKERKTAIKAAWKTYHSARKSAWKTFKDTMKKTCKVTDLSEDAGEGDGE